MTCELRVTAFLLITRPRQDIFQEKILQALRKPDDEYTDSSPIGAVDPNIRQLVNQINETDGYVTTSSCAGRISVFLEGAAKSKDDSGNDEGRTSSSAQGKGGGSWLFVSHDPVDVRTVQEDGALFELFSLPKDARTSFPSADEVVRFVHFKFEPMVSGVCVSSTVLCLSHSLLRSSTFSPLLLPTLNTATQQPCQLAFANLAL